MVGSVALVVGVVGMTVGIVQDSSGLEMQPADCGQSHILSCGLKCKPGGQSFT